jgi:NAD-dependent DNA ligase
MTASNCWQGFGQKKLEPIVAKLGVSQLLTGRVSKAEMLGIPGIGSISADKFLAELPVFLAWLEQHPMLRVQNSHPAMEPTTTTGPLSGLTVIMTGFRDKELEKLVIQYGGHISETVKAKATTTIIIAKDPSSNSSKLAKARELGLQIMTNDEFKNWLKSNGLANI